MKLVANTFQCLLPLANTPLIEYTLEFLSTAGVSDVYVVCSSYAEVVENYILKSKWSLASSPFSIHVLKSPESQSVGDALALGLQVPRDISVTGFDDLSDSSNTTFYLFLATLFQTLTSSLSSRHTKTGRLRTRTLS